jgi:hypothetical protein
MRPSGTEVRSEMRPEIRPSPYGGETLLASRRHRRRCAPLRAALRSRLTSACRGRPPAESHHKWWSLVSRRFELDESPHRRQLTEYDPPEIGRLRGSLAMLRFVAFGSSGSPGIRDGSGQGAEWSMPDSDTDRGKRRNELRRILEGLDRLASDVHRAVLSDLPIASRCRRCQTDLRSGSRFCDRCGARQGDSEVTRGA